MKGENYTLIELLEATASLSRAFGRVCRMATLATLKIDSKPQFKALFVPELQQLSGLFKKNGYEMRIAGGAVRDLLMGLTPADVDFASTATPPQMQEMFKREKVRMLHKKGEEHGTVTCRIGEHNFEITTLRIDVLCDGRRAQVEYTKDWELDAERRDLTINSLFLDLDGNVIDYTGGIEDIGKRRVAFVKDPATRICEDFLRILRYFRFFGRIADAAALHEEATLKAIIDNKGGLAGVSAERIWTELKRIVIGRLAPEVMETMIVDCHLTDQEHLDRYKRVYARGKEAEKDVAVDGREFRLESMTMVAALCSTREEVAKFHAKMKLSNAERELGEFIVDHRDEAAKAVEKAQRSVDDVASRRFWRRFVVSLFGPSAGKLQPDDSSRLRSRVIQLAITSSAPDAALIDILSFDVPHFPVTGIDLMNAKVVKGPKMQFTKNFLFDLWIQSDFTLTKDKLLERAHDPSIPTPPSPKNLKRKRTPTWTEA